MSDQTTTPDPARQHEKGTVARDWCVTLTTRVYTDVDYVAIDADEAGVRALAWAEGRDLAEMNDHQLGEWEVHEVNESEDQSAVATYEHRLDEIREVVLDGVRDLYDRLLGPKWDRDGGVDESTFDYEAMLAAALSQPSPHGRSGE